MLRKMNGDVGLCGIPLAPSILDSEYKLQPKGVFQIFDSFAGHLVFLLS